jgi:hypothetical protein
MAEEGNEGLGFRAALTPDLQNHEYITAHKEVKDLAADYVAVKSSVNDLTTKYTEAGNKLTEYEGKLKDALFIPGSDAPPEKQQEFRSRIEGYVKDNILKDNYIPKPKENATDEEKAVYYKAIGRPDTPESYEFPKVELPAGLEKQIDPEAEKAFRADAFMLGLTKEQAGFIYKQFMERNVSRYNQSVQAQEQSRQDGELALKSEWGAKYAENAEITNRGMEKVFKEFPNLKAKLEAAQMGNDPEVMKFFHFMGNAFVGDTLIRSEGIRNEHEAREPGKLKYPSMEQAA